MADKLKRSTFDDVWVAIMKNDISATAEPDDKKWHVVQEDSPYCAVCKATEGSVMVRCGTPGCKKLYHLDCANNAAWGGLSLSECGEVFCVSWQCDAHFTPPRFCICKQPYDEELDMVQCDECLDWFHTSKGCEDLAVKPSENEKYRCRSCRALHSKGKKPDPALADANRAKEALFMAQADAVKGFSALQILDQQLNNLLDILQHPGATSLSSKQVRAAAEIMSVSPFVPCVPDGEFELDEREEQLVAGLGVLPLVADWRQRVAAYLARVEDWCARAEGYFRKNVPHLTLSDAPFAAAQLPLISEVCAGLEQLSAQADSQLVGLPSDLDPFLAFTQCVLWLRDLLSLLHGPKADNWVQKLGQMQSAGVARGKLLASHSASLYFSYSADFQQTMKAAAQAVAGMHAWSRETDKILDAEEEYELISLEEYLESAGQFPARPLLYEELGVRIAEARQLEGEIDLALQASTPDHAALQGLRERQDELGVLLPSEDRFAAVSERLIFAKALEMIGEGRVRESVVRGLADRAEALLAPSPDSSALRRHLDREIGEAAGRLAGMLGEAEAMVQRLGLLGLADLHEVAALANLASLFSKLGQLQGLVIIRPEEELLVFLQAADALTKEAGAIAARREAAQAGEEGQGVLLAEVAELVGRLQGTLTPVVDDLPAAAAPQARLKQLLGDLEDQHAGAERLWGIVAGAVADCDSGEAVTRVELVGALGAARATALVDAPTLKAAAELLERASEAEEEVGQLLRGAELADASAESVTRAAALVQRIRSLPLSEAVAGAAARRRRVCSCVVEGVQVLAAQMVTGIKAEGVGAGAAVCVGAEADLPSLSDKELHLLRELSATVSQLSLNAEEPEARLLQSVHGRLLLHHWRAELRHMWEHGAALGQAQQLLRMAEEAGASKEAPLLWSELRSQVQRAGAFASQAEAIMGRLGAAEEADVESPERLVRWEAATRTLGPELELALKAETGLRISNAPLRAALTEALELLLLVSAAHSRVAQVHRVMQTSAADVIAQGLDAPVSFREITELANRLSGAAERHPGLGLLRQLQSDLGAIHQAAGAWDERTTLLLPKTTRQKRSEAVPTLTREDLLRAMGEPIARAVVVPSHEKLLSALAEAAHFRARLQTFLLRTGEKTEAGKGVGGKKGEGVEVYQSDDFSEQLSKDREELASMKVQAEAVPLDLPEMKVLTWLSSLFEWIETTPLPGDDPARPTPIDQAHIKFQNAQPLVANVSTSIIKCLVDLGVVEVDPLKGPTGFHPSSHPNLTRAGQLLEHLETQIARTEELHTRINMAVIGKLPTAQLLLLQAEATTLLVQPSLTYRRALEKRIAPIAPKKKIGGAGGDGGVESSDEGAWAGEEAEDYDFADMAAASYAEEEKGKGKAKATKKRKETADSLVSAAKAVKVKGAGAAVVSAGASAGAGVGVGEKPRKRGQCANPQCGGSAARGSLYCGAHCAMTTSSSMLAALVRYRKLLCLWAVQKGQGNGQGQGGAIVDPHSDLAQVSAADWAAFSCGGQGGGLGPLERGSGAGAGAGAGAGVGVGEGMLAHVHLLLAALPPAAGPVYLRGDLAELRKHSGVLQSRGLAPVPVVANPVTPNAAANAVASENDLRRVVRLVLEDLVAKALGRRAVRGAGPHAAAVALDFEGELYARYGGGGAGLDKSKYSKHYSMLRQNLGKAHNDQLVERLVSCEVSMPQLLDMTAAQLADAGTQQRRQQQLSELMSDKVRFSSVEEVAKLREDEARQGLEAVMDVGMAGVGAGASAPTSPKDGGAMDVEVSGSAETKRRLEAPSDQLAKQARTTSGPSLRIDPATSASGSAVPSPRAPSLLNSILANKVATTAAKSSAGPVHYEELSSAAKPQLLTFLSSAAQLITSSGGSAVTITRPGTGAKRAVTMAGEAWVLDRQLQGIAKPLMNIDGRVKLEEFVRIINKLQAMLNDARALSSPYRKLFSVFRMAVKGAGVEGSEAAASYKSFCTEFATENRVGLSNIGPKDSAGGAQMYVLPPALRHCLPIFGSFDELQEGMEGVGRGDELLYGVITNKDKGPEAYVSGEFFVSDTSESAPVAPAPVPPPRAPVAKPPAAPLPRAPPAPPPSTTPTAPTAPSAPRPPPAPAPPAPTPTAPTAPTAPTLTRDVAEKIDRVAKFCAQRGAQFLRDLQAKPESRRLMGFLFEGDANHGAFLDKLRAEVQAHAQK